MSAAFEYARSVRDENSLFTLVQSAIGEVGCSINDLLDASRPVVNTDQHTDIVEPVAVHDSQDHCDFKSDTLMRPNIEKRIKVFWSGHTQHYAGAVTGVIENGMCFVTNDEDEVETLNITNEIWKFERTYCSPSFCISG